MLLREIDRKRLEAIFATATQPIEVWAYGSRVNGNAHSGSDLDLVIRSENLQPLPPELVSGLVEQIRESHIPILVELRDLATLPASFQQNILQQYEVLFSNTHLVLKEPAETYKPKPGEK